MQEIPVEIIMRPGLDFWISGFSFGFSLNVLICYVIYLKFLRPRVDLDEIKAQFAEIISDAARAVARDENIQSAVLVAYVKCSR